MFGDAALDSDQQLAALGDQWVFKLGEDKYYLPTSKRHFTILFFQSVTKERRIDWIVTRNAESVHISILTFQGYSRSGPTSFVTGLCPGIISKELPTGRIQLWRELSWTNFLRPGPIQLWWELSSTQWDFANYTFSCHPIGPQTNSWTAPSHGMQHSTWVSDASGSPLQEGKDEEGKERTRPSLWWTVS